MSDFLLNLARRSAGLAAVMRARAAPPLEGSVETSQVERPPALPSDVRPPTTETAAQPRGSPSSTTQAVAPVERLVPAPPLLATASLPVAQRTPLPSPAVTGPAEPAPAVGAPDATLRVVAAVAAPATPAQREPPPVVSSVAEELAPLVTARPENPIMEVAPVILPAPTVERMLPESNVLLQRGEPLLAEERGAPVIELPAPASPSPIPVTVVPGDTRELMIAPLPLHAEPVQLPERTVHVRIGAIEIHGVESPAAPPPPAPLPPSTPPATVTAGFDEFARLRSYAPWPW